MVVADRESDIFEAFALRPDEAALLVRVARDRALAEGGTLFAALDRLPEAGRCDLDLPARPGRRARTAHWNRQPGSAHGSAAGRVAPGPIWTPLQPSGGQHSETIPDFGAQVPLGRPGQPAELAPVYVLLASKKSSFVAGEIYGVTGGNHLP